VTSRRQRATKATKITKITKTKLVFFMVCVAVVIFVARLPSAVSAQAQQPSGQKPPVFRVGTNLVTVDAYPTRDGKVIPDLKSDDFEVFEDGKPQKVETLEYVDYGDRLPDDDRPTMLSPREGLELAAEAKYRVIVFVIDRQSFDREMWGTTRGALIDYLRTSVEPRDLIGMVTTDDPWQNLLLGRRLASIEEEISNPEWLRTPYREDALVMAGCGMDQMMNRVRADNTYTLLEGIVRVLGQVREDHSSIVLISNGISRAPVNNRDDGRRSVTLPQTSLVNGRIQRTGPDMHEQYCKQESRRLNQIDFNRRFEDLARSARGANVSFYPIVVPRLQPLLPQMMPGRGAQPDPNRLIPVTAYQKTITPESLEQLAKDTNGFGVRYLNEMGSGLKRIASDAGSHYLLGYYTTNTKADGKLRAIRVRLKRTGAEIRARRDYRAPSNEEMTGLAAPKKPGEKIVPAPVGDALSVLSRMRPSAQFTAYGALAGNALTVVIEVPAIAVDAGRWNDGASIDVIAEAAGGETVGMGRGKLAANGRATIPVTLDGSKPPANMMVRLRAEGESLTERVRVGVNPTSLVGDPVAVRSGSRGLGIPVASFVFAHDERLKLDWPVLGPVEQLEARLLDRYGLPLAFKMPVEDQQGSARHAIANITFSPLARGDYVVELTARAAGRSEVHYLALRVN
jgi:VWFA-related protein